MNNVLLLEWWQRRSGAKHETSPQERKVCKDASEIRLHIVQDVSIDNCVLGLKMCTRRYKTMLTWILWMSGLKLHKMWSKKAIISTTRIVQKTIWRPTWKSVNLTLLARLKISKRNAWREYFPYQFDRTMVKIVILIALVWWDVQF